MEGHLSVEPRKFAGRRGARSTLVVYDDREVVDTLTALLKRQGHFVSGADDGISAVDIFVAQGGFDLVLSRRNLPDVDEEALRRMISDLYPKTDFLFFEEIKVFKGSTADFLRLQMKDLTISARELLELVEQVLTASKGEVPRRSTEKEQLKRCLFNVISLFSSYLEQYEFVTGGKGKFIKDLVVAVAHQMGLPSDMVDEIAVASLIFDIGMVKVSPKVKLKPSNLTEGELVQIKAHCFYGAEIVEKVKFPWDIASIVLHHHERYDGKGYPRGLKGREIPIGSRVISVADAFYAMTSRRPNRPPLTNRQAAEELRKGAGTQFDPEIVEIFLSLIRRRGLEAHDSDTPPKVVLLGGLSDYAGALIATRFDYAGQLVIRASSRDDLQQKLASALPDFVICDVEGLGLSGSTTATLREELGIGEIPALWLSDPGLEGDPRGKADIDRIVTRPARLQEIVAEVNTVLLRSEFYQASKGEETEREVYGIHGNLIELNLIEIVQMLHQGGKTAEVALCCGGETAKLFFATGQIRHAEYGNLHGEEAFFEILKIDDGEFVIEHTRTPPTITIERRTDLLLLDGMRRIDEENRDRGEDQAPENLPEQQTSVQ